MTTSTNTAQVNNTSFFPAWFPKTGTAVGFPLTGTYLGAGISYFFAGGGVDGALVGGGIGASVGLLGVAVITALKYSLVASPKPLTPEIPEEDENLNNGAYSDERKSNTPSPSNRVYNENEVPTPPTKKGSSLSMSKIALAVTLVVVGTGLIALDKAGVTPAHSLSYAKGFVVAGIDCATKLSKSISSATIDTYTTFMESNNTSPDDLDEEKKDTTTTSNTQQYQTFNPYETMTATPLPLASQPVKI